MTTLSRPVYHERFLAHLDDRVAEMVDLHFHPRHGSRFWLDRAASLGIDARQRVRCVEGLALLGPMPCGVLRGRSVWDMVPQAFHGSRDRFVLGQTGGTTGRGIWTAYRDDEFDAAFILPFLVAAQHVGFPRGEPWLFVGPTGPHVIGKAMRGLARVMGSPDPFSIDFDPRWAKTLGGEPFARNRYLRHLIDQAMDVIEQQRVTVLFSTPIVLRGLADAMSTGQRERVRAVHYGGMALSQNDLNWFQTEVFPAAVHLSGYGNTLFGCCMELSSAAGRVPTYFPHGNRLLLGVVDENGEPVAEGRVGRVRFTRLDESCLMINVLERDVASPLPVPTGAPAGFALMGVVNPQPEPNTPMPSIGLY